MNERQNESRTEAFMRQLQSNPVMQQLANQFAQCADMQERVDFIGSLLGCYDPVRIADRDQYDACEKERKRLLRNWARRQHHRAAKLWNETGVRVPYERRPIWPCTCGYHEITEGALNQDE